MKLHHIIFNVILLFFCISHLAQAQQKTNLVKTIVIDAGHGGKDPGAVNGTLYEKNITLSVALKLGKMINAEHPDIKVVYTRTNDSFVPLQNRGAIANRANADLFISIHTNAAKATSASGTETYIMGIDKSGANLAVAMRENDVITYEADYTTRYEGYEPGSSESFIIFSLMNYAYQSKSLRMANLVQKEFAAGTTLKNRGVKQAGYLVLWHTAMPSILTEIGFISNPTDSKFLASESGQQKIAQLLFNATTNYIREQQSSPVSATTPNQPPEPKIEKPAAEPNGEVYYTILAAQSTTPMAINSQYFGPFVSVVEQVEINNSYKYYIERRFSYKEALLLHKKIKDLIPRATLEAFRGTKSISLEEARKSNP